MALKHVAVVVGPINIGAADMIRCLRFLGGKNVAKLVVGDLAWQCMLNRVLSDRDMVLVNFVAMVHVSRAMRVTSESWNFVWPEALRSVMMLGFHMLENLPVMVQLLFV